VKRWRRPPLQHPLAPAFARAVESLCTALTPSSTRNYNMVVRHFLVYLGAEYPEVAHIKQLRRDPHILGWMACLRAQTPPLATATCIGRLFALRTILNELAWANKLPDLAQLLRREDIPRTPHTLPRPLTAEQDQLLEQEFLRRNDLGANVFLLLRRTGMRIVGPNCLGVLVSHEHGAINATFTPTLPPSGSIAISSQSGALGIAILQTARSLGLGVSTFVSIGNKADLSSNDLIEYWEEDPATKVIVLYLESFGNPRRFARIARRVGARKPILAVKGGRSTSGRRAAASHTAALAGSDVAVDALFKQAGVIRAETLEELFEISTLFANQPLPTGKRVAVLTNAGGLGILCADACEANGLELPQLREETKATLRAMLPMVIFDRLMSPSWMPSIGGSTLMNNHAKRL